MAIFNVTPQLIYPTSRQFPFDDIGERIVRAIEKRNWEIPGISIEFRTYGSGEEKYQYISDISGDDFKLHFGRPQGSLNEHLNNVAALSEVAIPKQIIHVFDDESGPSYCLYVGKNWEKDKKRFMNSLKVHSKMNKEERTYLKYDGNHSGRRSSYLVHDNDLGREYDPVGDEPRHLCLATVFEEIINWLETNLLTFIMNFSEASQVVYPPVPREQLIPYEGPWPLVFTTSDWRMVERIETAKKDINNVKPYDRYVYFGSGSRLCNLGISQKNGDGSERFPKIAYEGFIWCDTNQTITQVSTKKELSSYVRNGLDDKHIIAIRPKYANHLYVIDNSVYEETREALFASIAPRERLTNAELDDVIAARGATIVPIQDYKGNYKEPMLLIERELDFDEIEWIVEEERRRK